MQKSWLTVNEVNKVLAYCLFCETQRCSQIADLIRRKTHLICILPSVIQRKWIRGVPTEERHDLLPGYFFIYSEKRIDLFFDIKGVIRVLGNGPLKGQDLIFAQMIFYRKGIIGTVLLEQTEEGCMIIDKAWTELCGRVIKMDRGRKRCCIEYQFNEITRTIWLGYEIVYK